VGGDFYDAFAIEENRWGIAIGDVCGKGAQAAALTALARYTIRALADRDCGTVLARLNEAVVRDGPTLPERLLTALFAVASTRGGRLQIELAAAGHPPPLILRADGTAEQVEVSGLLIGVSAGVDYGTTRLELAPGDTIVLYTDGLTDVRAPRRILSEENLQSLLEQGRGLGAEALAEFLERSATGGEDPRDDIALLVIEVLA
jgi:sigma-B regulation protein RsbU (phosphoserine phosphatase)